MTSAHQTPSSPQPVLSLTREEAAARSELIAVTRYDIAVDLNGLLDGNTVESVSTITFTCEQPGAATFVDCVATIDHATLNGQPLDPSTASGGRLPLPGLAAENVLVVAAHQSDTGSSAGILRTVDPSDQLVYVWTSFEPDDARRIWACFDQPDLKAPHGFTVSAPESWTVTSNSAPDAVTSIDDQGAAKLWRFADTPPLSTYVVVVNAGPFLELRSERGGYDLGLYARQSLRPFLERDAEELFTLTEQCLEWFGERFDLPFPQRRYDQVFVPNMGGAMENWGCVTWTDSVLHRSEPTYSRRLLRAEIVAHEMAHMWFGDLVTMRWWDDLWLNEAFASWAASWALAGATAFDDTWVGFAADHKPRAYALDRGPASHPIRGVVPDVAAAMANFDAITYLKGQSVLKQLATYVGEDHFVTGLRAYFHRHAWGNTCLDDLMSAVGEAAGLDLSAWTSAWLDRPGTDRLALHSQGDSADAASIQILSPDGQAPRPHTFAIGSYAVADDTLTRVATTSVCSSGSTAVVDLPAADLHLLNDDDQTFATIQPDAASLHLMLTRAGQFPTAMARALAVTTGWTLLAEGEVSGHDFMTCVLGALRVERSAVVVDPFLRYALSAAEYWSPPSEIGPHRRALAEVAQELAAIPDTRLPALHALAATAETDAQFALLERAATDDPDLGWRLLRRRAELGEIDDDAVRALIARDRDPESATRAFEVRASHPSTEAKSDVWRQIFTERAFHAGQALGLVGAAFWRPAQDDVLRPFTWAFLDEIRQLGDGGLLHHGAMASAMMPRAAMDDDYLSAAERIAHDTETPASVRQPLLSHVDTVRRQLRARAR